MTVKRLAWLGALLLMAACQGSTTPVANPTPTLPRSPAASPTTGPGSVLVFQAIAGATTTLTLTRSDGSVIKTIQATGQGSTWQGPSAALLLMSGDKAVAVMSADGSVTPIPVALVQYFGGSNIGNLAGDAILVTPTLAIGTMGYDPASFVEVDFASGQATTLLSAKRIAPAGGIAPPIVLNLGTSTGGGVAHILVRHADTGVRVAQWGLVEIDLKHHVVVGIPDLPLASGLDAYDGYSPALSADASRFAYVENATSRNGYAVLRVHIADVTTRADAVSPDNAIRVLGQQASLSFSPDGSYLVAYGQDAWPDASGKTTAKLVVFDAATAAPARTVDVGDATFNMIQVIGWTGPHTIAYAVTDTSQPGYFIGGRETDYVLDVATGTRQTLPSGIGSLVGVLNPSP